MKKVVLLQEAGFLWDLYFIFYLRFNDQIFFEKSSAYNQVKKHTEFYKEIQLRFGDVSEDLSVFFCAGGIGKPTFLHDCYLEKFENNFIDEYNVEYLQQELSDYNQVVQNMIAFCFKGIARHELTECVHSKEVLFDRIKASNYSIEKKSSCTSFS